MEAGSHDNSDDANADGGARQRPGAAFEHLQGQTFDCDLSEDTEMFIRVSSCAETCWV